MVVRRVTLLGRPQEGTVDATALGLERWLYLTQVLQTHCVGGSISAYRQRKEVMGSLNWAINSIWTAAPAWGSISHDGLVILLNCFFVVMIGPALVGSRLCARAAVH